MPYRSWLLAVAIGLIACLGQAQDQAGGPDERTDQQQEPSQTLPVPLLVEIVEDQGTADARQRGEEREIKDLDAQKGMNDATQAIKDATNDMRDYAQYSTWLVVGGNLLLILTLGLTIQANKAASRAAEASVGMNELTEAVERPLLGIKMPEDHVTIDQTWRFENEIKFKIVNMGRSPAKITEIQRSWFASVDGKHPPIINPNDCGLLKTKRVNRYVAGGSKTEGVLARSHVLRAASSAPELIFFHGWIRFEDMGGKKFVAGFSYFIDPSRGDGFTMAWPDDNADKYNYCREY